MRLSAGCWAIGDVLASPVATFRVVVEVQGLAMQGGQRCPMPDADHDGVRQGMAQLLITVPFARFVQCRAAFIQEQYLWLEQQGAHEGTTLLFANAQGL